MNRYLQFKWTVSKLNKHLCSLKIVCKWDSKTSNIAGLVNNMCNADLQKINWGKNLLLSNLEESPRSIWKYIYIRSTAPTRRWLWQLERSTSLKISWIASYEKKAQVRWMAAWRRESSLRQEKDHNRQNIGWRSLNSSFSQVAPTAPPAAWGRGQEASGDSLNQVPRGEVKLWGLRYLSHLQVWFRFTAANSIS